MKKKLSYLFWALAFLAFANVAFAQTPKIPGTHWSFDNHTMYDAVLSGELFINGESMKNVADAEYLEIGAFCGDECRGSYLPDDVQLPFYSGFAYQMQVYSNVASGEEITFRIYDHLTETELDFECNSPIIFTANNVYGDLLNPFHLDFTMDLPEIYEITVSATPADGGSVEGGGIYEEGETVTVTATPAADCYFINWTENGEVVSEEFEYTFVVTANRNLVAHFDVDSVIELGDHAFTIYPNPVSEKLYIECAETIVKYEIYNISGSLVYSSEGNSTKIEVDVASLSAGSYIIRSIANDVVRARRFTKN